MKRFYLSEPVKTFAATLLRGIALILAWLVILPAAFPQQNGIVEGRLVNRTNPSLSPRGVELEVIGLRGGMSILKSAETDDAGRFRIGGLPGNEPLMVRANYQGVNYHRQLSFDSSGKANVEIEVFESTASMKEVQAEPVRMAFQLAGDRLKSVEALSINNKTKPPKTYMNPDGNFRFSKSPGIIELPQLNVKAPGSSMPLVQSALESPDGQSYYSLYPLRPGITSFEVDQTLPYGDRKYVYSKKFYMDIPSIEINVIPQDMILSGTGLSKIRTDPGKNLVVYQSAPVKAGTEVVWTFSGGTPVAEPQVSEPAGESEVVAMPDSVGQNALIIGPLLLMTLLLVLWYAFNHTPASAAGIADSRVRQLKERREQLLNHIADLDRRHETNTLSKPELLRLRGESMRQLRRISQLLK
jgi:hypothetical protein